MATLRLMRSDEKTNQKAEMSVFLDGKLLGTISNGTNEDFQVPSGKHKLKVKIDSAGSKTYTFDILENETKAFILSNNKNANTFGPFGSGAVLIDFIVNGIMLLYYFTIGQNRYIKIKSVDKSWI